MFAPMIPLTERTHRQDENHVAQNSTWHPLVALFQELNVNRQERVQREVAQRSVRPVEEPAAQKAAEPRLSLNQPS
jgi:hypothetical protein